jgi:hypothetical protein
LAEKLQTPMTRRKGEITPKRIDRDFPFQVEMPIPPGGLKQQNEHREFCRQRGFEFATRGIGKLRRIEERDAVRYCFRPAADAEAFQAARGGGERVALPAKKPPAPSIGRRAVEAASVSGSFVIGRIFRPNAGAEGYAVDVVDLLRALQAGRAVQWLCGRSRRRDQRVCGSVAEPIAPPSGRRE